MRSEDSYDDIINLPHHISLKRPQMPMHDRAAQFSPFAALTGYDEAIKEEGRLTSGRIELGEYETELLDRSLRDILEHINERPYISVIYFEPDERKSGGAYMEKSGRLKRIDEYERKLYFTDGTGVDMDSVIEINQDLIRI